MEPTNNTTPDDLMHHFRGRSLKSIIIFTVIVHFVVIGATSVPYMVRALTGPDTEAMTEDERIELAVKEATSTLQQIANEHGIRPQELGDQLSGNRRPPVNEVVEEEEAPEPTRPEPTVTPEVPAAPDPPVEPEAPKSEIEKELEKSEPGPTLPPVEEAVDLFE